MITEETNFNIPQVERDKLNRIGSRIAYDFINLKESEIFDFIAKAWYWGNSHGVKRKSKSLDYPKDMLIPNDNHGNFDKLISYEDHLIIKEGGLVKYYNIPGVGTEFLVKEVCNHNEEFSKLHLVKAIDHPVITGAIYLVIIKPDISLASINTLKEIL